MMFMTPAATLRTASLLFAIAMVAAACGTPSGSSGAEDVVAAPTETTSTVSIATQDEDATESTEVSHDEDTSDGIAHDEGAAEDEGAVHEDGPADDHMEEAADEASPSDRRVEISMTDMAFTPDAVNVTAGETITFLVSNDGATLHEFRLSNAHRIEEHLASGHGDHDEEGGHHGDADVVLELLPGESGEITVTFPEDDTLFTEVACLIPGHYEAGMKGHVAYE